MRIRSFIFSAICLNGLLVSQAMAMNEVSFTTGIASANFDNRYTATPSGLTLNAKYPLGESVPMFGLQYHYLFQKNHFLFGPEIGFNYIDAKPKYNLVTSGSTSGTVSIGNEISQAINASFYLGYSLAEKVRLYANLGLSQANTKYVFTADNPGTANDVSYKQSSTLLGALFKIGITAKLAPHWLGSVGWQYMNYPTKSLDTKVLTSVPYQFKYQTTVSAGTVSVTYQF